MQSEKDFLQNFKACEAVINSPTTSCDEKCSAWRMQNLLLSHLTRNHNQTVQCTAQRKQMQKLDFKTQTEFVQQRAKTVDSLLSGFTPKVQETMDLTDNDDSDTLNYEASCCGAYESCRDWEMKESYLKQEQQQRNALLKDDDDTLIVQAVSNFNESIKEQKAKPSEEKIARNTLTSYLQRIPSQSTTSNSKMGGNKEQINQQRVATASGSNCDFRTALEVFQSQNMKKYGNSYNPSTESSSSSSAASTPLFNYGATKKTLGARRTMRSDFVSPLRAKTPPPTDERLKNIDPKMVELITNEIMHKLKPVDWTDIAGLDYAKSVIKEAVVYPLLRPDIFTGLRRPPRGILLFGPPGTGKTLIGKCIASDSQSTFFSISASSLTSKWIGDGEKMVRALFAVAAVHQPSVVFIDEIDSILSQRSETEHESSRRLKTEFLIQLDGATTSEDDRILIVGATNRPQELDEAARRRLVRRLYIPLPELEARIQILMNLLKSVRNNLIHNEIHEIGKLTVGYSGADMESLCREASMEPIRSIPPAEIRIFSEDKVRPICMQDFIAALNTVRPSVSQDDLQQYTKWNLIYGAGK